MGEAADTHAHEVPTAPAGSSFSRVLLINPDWGDAEAFQGVGDNLVECVRRSRASAAAPTIVLATEEQIQLTLDDLRLKLPNLLVGSAETHQWMLPALDVVVATPEQANYACSFILHCSHVPAFLLASAGRYLRDQADKLLDGTFNLKSPVRFPRNCPPQVSPPSAACGVSPGTGFGDECFETMLDWFGQGNNLVHQDESGILIFMPGLLRAAAGRRPQASLLLVPQDKASNIVDTLEYFLDHMSLRHVNVVQCGTASLLLCHIAVGAPEAVEEALETKGRASKLVSQMVLLDTDTLIETGSLQQIEDILQQVTGRVQLGLHARTTTEEVQKLVQRFLGDEPFLQMPQSHLTLEGVIQYYVMVKDGDDRLEETRKVWDKVARLFPLVAVYCKTVEEVQLVSGRMTCPTVVTHTDMKAEQVADLERDCRFGQMLVTNVYKQGCNFVINFGLPATSDEYLQRCGRDRNRAEGRVVNLVTQDEIALMISICKELGVAEECVIKFE